MSGPLDGVRVLELAGIGPGPFGTMVLADLGADVVRVDRRADDVPSHDPLARSRRSIAVNLKRPEGVAVIHRLAAVADVLVDPFRPGVTERNGIGPDDLRAINPRLIYARMTGWGQTGPMAPNAGHDINYIALAGVLHGIGRAGEAPVPPQNYIGDFGGGGMLLAVGVLAALFERERSGQGQVLDVAMVDGSALLTGFVRGVIATGNWVDERGVNLLDTGAHNYDVYETADGKYVALGLVEQQFYDRLLEVTGLDDDDLRVSPLDRAHWARLKPRMSELMRTKTRDQWCELLEGETEMCFAPVLTLDEAPEHPHLRARATFVDVGGQIQPAPAPRFSRTVPAPPRPGPAAGGDTEAVLLEAGYDHAAIAGLRAVGAVS